MPGPDRRGPLVAVLLAVTTALTGCATSAPAAPASPTPSRSAGIGRAAGPQDPAPDVEESTQSARPVRIVIPAIHVDAPLVALRRGADGVLQPPPATRLDAAGWYAGGTVPGDVGPAVIAGHVDWVDRVAVFSRLDQVRAGDAIDVAMRDGSMVRFRVDGVRSVAKDRFPTASVYGPTPDAQLRVITCGGPWDDARDIYSENVIVSASEVR